MSSPQEPANPENGKEKPEGLGLLQAEEAEGKGASPEEKGKHTGKGYQANKKSRHLIVVAVAIVTLLVVLAIIIAVVTVVVIRKRSANTIQLETATGSTLIKFKQGLTESYEKYTRSIQAFLRGYENENQSGENFIDCSHGRPQHDPNKVCRFQLESLGSECISQKEFGYDEGTPCVPLMLKRVYGWKPELYVNVTRPKGAPREWHKSTMGMPVTCQGENPADRDNMGQYVVYPADGFPKYFFPYLDQEGYRQPIVMVRFVNPTPGVVISIRCKAWAKNIKEDEGSLLFQLMID